MLTAIVWVLFLGLQPLATYPTLTDCAANKQALQAKYPNVNDLMACVPQGKGR